MIEWFMFGALGFFLGCLLGLMLAPPLWNRAVKLTTRRLEATMPMTLAEIQADKDQIRADFALQLRKVEVALEKSKEKAARELIEANKRRVEIQKLNGSLESAKGELHEAENANRVLQQTIKRRLPDLDARLKAAKKALSDLEAVNAELRTTISSQSDALKVARATVQNQRADIDQLRLSLESGSAGGRSSSKNDSRAVAENQRLTAELSRAQEELERVRTSSDEIEFLRRELNQLASHILDAARQQGPAWQNAAAAQAATHNETDSLAEPQQAIEVENGAADTHDEAAFVGNGAAEHAADPADSAYAQSQYEASYAEQAGVETSRPRDTISAPTDPLAEEDYQAEEAHSVAADAASASNFAGPTHGQESHTEGPTFDVEDYSRDEDHEIEEDFETYEIQEHYAAQGRETGDETEEPGDEAHYDDEPIEQEEAEEADEEPRGLATRFAARRAKRRAQKSGGGSLTSRLRRLVADSPETRG